MSMTRSQLGASSVRRVLLVGGLALLAALLVIPRVAGQETSTLEFDVVTNRDSLEVAKALGNPPDGAVLARGDVRSGQGDIRIGDERVGTFYLLAVVTVETQHFASAANHVQLQAYLELFGDGTLAATGVGNLTGPFNVAITGGTGRYSGAGGQCLVTHEEGMDHWVCEVR